MKVIEEPAFKLENSMGFDALVEREMEALEGGFCIGQSCSGQCNGQSGGSTTTTTTTTTSTTTSAI